MDAGQPAGPNDPDTGDIYSGLDRFGRVKDNRWLNGAGADLDRIQYGYDRAGNRIWRKNVVAAALGKEFDELYAYDGVHRLQDMARGTLNAGQTALTSETFAQCWTLDSTGNWHGFRQADSGDPWDLVQARLANPVNEITGITNSTGPAWAQPAYDGAGNMTTIPQPADPTASYTATYDAWNRLVKLVDPATGHTVQENEYDGRGYRTVRKSYTAGVLSETRQFYYTDGWRDVEERLGTSPDTADPDRQFVWGIRYIDDLVLRDRSDAGTLDERLYACQDANWNLTAVVDDAGEVQERYEYDPYGQLTVLSPPFVLRAGSSFGWETTYAGYRFDAVSRLYAVRFRFYSAALGAWLQRDPIGVLEHNLDLYGYVGSMPTHRTDPLGLFGISISVPWWWDIGIPRPITIPAPGYSLPFPPTIGPLDGNISVPISRFTPPAIPALPDAGAGPLRYPQCGNRPPSNCPPQVHDQLSQAKDAACSGLSDCIGMPNAYMFGNWNETQCEAANAVISQRMACLNARLEFAIRCFMGFDQGHRVQAQGHVNAINRCVDKMRRNGCYNMTNIVTFSIYDGT